MEALMELYGVRNEKTNVDTIRAFEDRNGNLHLTTWRRQQPKMRHQGNSGFQNKLVAARRQMTRRAVRALGKGCIKDEEGTILQMEPLKDRRPEENTNGAGTQTVNKGPKRKTEAVLEEEWDV